MPKKPAKSKTLVLKIKLCGAPLPIWRRIVVRADLPLDLLHEVFQIVMGWSNYHQHSFKAGSRNFADMDGDALDELEGFEDESEFTLQDLIKFGGKDFLYEYDWGDGWMHEVTVESNSSQVDPRFIARCITGKRACPPEDVGGVAGYAAFLESVEDPDHPEHVSSIEWVGCTFDADIFEPRTANLRLDLLEQELESISELSAVLSEQSKGSARMSTLSLVKDEN